MLLKKNGILVIFFTIMILINNTHSRNLRLLDKLLLEVAREVDHMEPHNETDYENFTEVTNSDWFENSTTSMYNLSTYEDYSNASWFRENGTSTDQTISSTETLTTDSTKLQTTTTTTTSEDQVEAFCREACPSGKGGVVCKCAEHPIG